MTSMETTLLTILVYACPWLVVPGAESSQPCRVYTASATCEHYHLISTLRFHPFNIDRRSLDTTCSQAQAAMSCVDNLLVGCEDAVRLPYEMQWSVLNATCHDRKQEFLDSFRCFSTSSLQERIITRCIAKTYTQGKRMVTEPCSVIEEIISCGSEAVRMTDGCTVQDAQLMEDLLSDFLSIVCETWKAGVTPTDSARTVTIATSTAGVPTPEVERPVKTVETDKPGTGSAPTRADKPVVGTDSEKSTLVEKPKNNSASQHLLDSSFYALSCLPKLLFLSHLIKVLRFS